MYINGNYEEGKGLRKREGTEEGNGAKRKCQVVPYPGQRCWGWERERQHKSSSLSGVEKGTMEQTERKHVENRGKYEQSTAMYV